MAQRMFGLETEYSLSALRSGGTRFFQGYTAHAFMETARKLLPHLPGRHSSGFFLQNGSRFYFDTGGHPELATPETVNPWDACRYVLAGDRMLAAVADQLARDQRAIGQVVVTRGNVCYSPGSATTSGCHECYAHRADLMELPSELIPHLVSRVIYTGSGGFDNRSPGIEFMVSPRVAHLEQVVSDASTHARGIYHSKNESLSCNGFHRLHVLCGESVCSHTTLWLKIAITALVVALVEARLSPCRAIIPRSPLAAMRTFAADVRCDAKVDLIDGRQMTAIEMQRHILARIEAHVDHPVMPPWSREACGRLRAILDRLDRGPGAVATTLDWAIKWSLYREFTRRRGVAWETLPDCNYVLSRLDRALRASNENDCFQPLSAELLHRRGPLAAEIHRLTPFMRANGMDRDYLTEIIALRHELFELDTRFTQLGDRGVFAALDRAGALDHALPGVDNIEHAVDHPPAAGRARLRGECIRRFHERPGEYSCDWTGVWDHRGGRYLDLSEPFVSEERWQKTF